MIEMKRSDNEIEAAIRRVHESVGPALWDLADCFDLDGISPERTRHCENISIAILLAVMTGRERAGLSEITEPDAEVMLNAWRELCRNATVWYGVLSQETYLTVENGDLIFKTMKSAEVDK